MAEIYANKGMYIETLIEKTILYYINNDICFFEKRYLPIRITKIKNKGEIEGRLLSKSYVDYIGLINGKFISFETKQTDGDIFLLNQLKDHQFKHLQLVNKFNGLGFLIIHFYKIDKTFLLTFPKLENLIANKIKKLSVETLLKNIDNDQVFELEIVFPGIINLYNVLEKITKQSK